MSLLFHGLWKVGGIGVLLFVMKSGFSIVDDSANAVLDMVRIVAADSSMNGFHKVLLSKYTRDEQYPQTAGELFEWFKEHYDKPIDVISIDPWQKPYWFLNREWEVRCSGPDGRFKSRDDLVQQYPQSARAPKVDGWLATPHRQQ